VQRVPVPLNGNKWNEDILRRMEAGESVVDIAASYGQSVSEMQMRAKKARDARAEGNHAHTAQTHESSSTARVNLSEVIVEASEIEDVEPKQPAATADALDDLFADTPITKEIYNDPEALGRINDAKFAEAAAKFGWKL
jgi:cell pole-organizing protein PopZ